MEKLYNLYHSVKHLKSTQLINRFQRKFIKPKIRTSSELLIRKPQATWLSVELLSSSYVKGEVFCFLNQQGEVSNWNDVKQEKLWLYNLHYFDGYKVFENMDNELIFDHWLKYDGHWNQKGSDLFAHKFAEYIQNIKR